MTERAQSSRLDLDDGRAVVVRALVPSDEEALRRAFESADPAVLRSRFGGATPRFSQIADRLRHLDGDTRYAAGAFDDEGNVVGVAEYVQSQADGPAEVAIIVARAWQRRRWVTRTSPVTRQTASAGASLRPVTMSSGILMM